MLLVPPPAVIVPPVMAQAYVAPAPALATDAMLPPDPTAAIAAVEMVAFGFGLTMTVVPVETKLWQAPVR